VAILTNHEDHLRIGNSVKFIFKGRTVEGTVMDFEDGYEGHSNLHGQVRIWGIVFDDGTYKKVNVWRKQEDVEHIERRIRL